MKKFSDIKVGDILHYINVGKSMYIENDQYGNTRNDGKIDGSFEIKSIAKVGNTIYFNPTYEYNKINSLLLSFESDQEYNSTSVEVKQKSYPYENRIYLSDERECSQLQREAALAEIRKQEQSIIDHKNECIKNIESIRERYYKVLNH